MRKIKWGILGTAKIAKHQMIPAIRATEWGEVLAVASRNEEKAKQFAQDSKIPKAYGSYQGLLNDPEIEAIYNPLPISLHAPWCLEAASVGKPTLCEKPLTASVAEAKKVIESFSTRKLLLAEALMYRYHPLTKKVKEIVQQGDIGEVQLIHTMFSTSPPPHDIRLQKETGGGALFDLGCYCVSFFRYITGEEPTMIRSIARFSEQGIDLATSGVLVFPSGTIANFSCSLCARFDCRYIIIGTKGSLWVDRGALVAWPGEDFIIKLSKGGKPKEIVVPAANPYQLLVEDFQRALLTHNTMEISLNDTLATIRVLEQIDQISRSSSP